MDHQTTHSFASKHQVVGFGQFLMGERRSKVGVVRLEQFEGAVLGLRIELMLAGTPTFLGQQPRVP